MTSIQFVIQPLPGTEEQFNERLREVSEKINKFGFDTHRVFEQLKVPVKEMVIGPNHIGVLLEDGKVFRIAFSINSDRLDLSKSDSSKNGASKNSTPSSSRQLARSRARLMRTTARSGSGGQSSGSRSTGVIIGGSSSNRPLVTVAAPFVPEELISQAEVVLQGKSRNLIIRELQRTNLDVNLAVNNLLSRDDEEVDENEEGGDNYVPEDLISLLDNGFHGDNNSVIIDPADGLFSEEIFSNYSSIRNLLFDRIRSERNQSNSSNTDGNQGRLSASTGGVLAGTNSLSAQVPSGLADREAFSRWRDRQCYGPRRWINREEFVWDKDTDIKKKEITTTTSPIWISDDMQPWPDKGNGLRFKKIAALHSEFIAISESGDLHQWKWTELEPYRSEIENIYHPKTTTLSITEKVEHISANFIRASVVTETNRVATWMDDQLGYFGMKLEHPAIAFSEFIIDPVVSVHVCSLYTAVRTETNNVYWWGVLPFEQRRLLWDKNRTKSKKPFKITSSEIAVGTQVIMKKCPIYQSGSIGFTCVNGVPKVGQLMNSVWDFNDVCRFKILTVSTVPNCEKAPTGGMTNPTTSEVKEFSKTSATSTSSTQSLPNTKSNVVNSTNKETTDRIDMPPPPSPASSTCSDTGSVISHKRNKRMATKDDSSDSKKDEEFWQLKDVVIVEDKIGPIGKVLKVDGDYIAVRFPVSPSTSSNISGGANSDGKEDDWQHCRLLRRDDVQIYKTAMSSRGPDWLQKLPKKIHMNSGNDSFQLLSLCVDTSGIHAIKKIANKVHYSIYNLYNSKQEQNCRLPTDSTAFMGISINNISMICNNDYSGGSIILRDGNRTLYPIAKDCINSIKDPHWFDLPPIKSASMITISLPASLGSNLKSKVCMTVLLFESQKLMPHILRCDAKNAFAVLSHLEKEDKQAIIPILEERCDGCRNIFHACVVMCAPTSNKETEEKDKKVVQPAYNLNSRPVSSTSFSNSGSGLDSESTSNSINAGSSNYCVGSANMSASSPTGRTVSLREMMNMEQPSSAPNPNVSLAVIEDHFYGPNWSTDSTISTNSNPTDTFMSGDDDICKMSKSSTSAVNVTEKVSTPNFVVDPIQRREQSTAILQYMCSSVVLRPYLTQLLSAKDAQGQTPFMLAISSRSYDAAIILLSTILNITEKDPTIQKESMIFPPGSSPDMSPLYVICYNDTCSFTWTGADHINQNIFECKTCGLTGSLCCCTECARVCHKGHDCKLKRTSPTAYCDCWEKCKCKALIAGNQQKRYSLLCKLVSTTDLVTKFNSKGESILLFLIQTVGRQTIEQRQYRANSRVRNVVNAAAASTSRKSSVIDADSDMPEHDLEPPKFARRALERLLVDWHAVRAMIMTGAEKFENVSHQLPNMTNFTNSENYNLYLQTQKGSTLLDKFTHNLFVKCSSEHLDTLVMTLVHEMQNDFIEGRMAEAEIVARRFVRSVVRVFVIFNLEKQPNPEKRKSSLAPNKHIQNCIKVFQSFHKISIQELCEVSEALIAPVRLGVLRPTAPFAMSSSNIDSSDDLFCVDPLAPSSSFFENVEPLHENPAEHTVPGFNLQSNYDGILGMRETSESEDLMNRESNSRGQDEDILESGRNDEVIQDDESDNDFTFNDAETESDSDDNQSNHDAQRSAQTRATVVSETDDSEDSSPQDEEASEDGETDEHSDEFNSVASHQLERRNVHTNSRSDLAPQSMQWAIRSRDAFRSNLRVPAGSSLVFIDPMALRRSNVPTSSAVTTPQEPHTTATTASNLARAFGIIIRQISELLSNLSYNLVNGIEIPLKIDFCESLQLQAFIETRLKPTWDWLFSVMDTTEAQLKFGAYLTNHTDPTHPLHPLNLSSQSSTNQSSSSSIGMNMIASSRREFFTYCLSIMRAHTSEHLDALPVLDISALRHIAYVLDGIIYYMRNDTFFYEKSDTIPPCVLTHFNENDDTDEELSNITIEDNFSESSSCSMTSRRNMLFFARSDSTLSLGCLAPEGFDLPIDEAIPLADKPHLLQPNSKREDLFANLPLIITPNKSSPKDASAESFEQPPTRLGFSKYTPCQPSHNLSNKDLKSDLLIKPSTSSGISLSETDNYVEDSTNVYVQLKKKQYTDETKASFQYFNNDMIKGSESEPMDIDNKDIAEKIPTKKVHSTITTRPEIIITPSKVQQRDTAESELSDINEKKGTTVRTVIVRAHASNKPTDNVINKQKYIEQEGIKTMRCVRGYHFCNAIVSSNSPSWNILIGRWKLTLDLFGRVFMDDVGMENSSVLPELRGFPVKEMRFRRHMEKLRNGQQRDLILSKLERNRDSLIIQTFKELNTQFGSQNRRVQPPLTFNRVKVTFKDEPGEGSGVARSFYTSISEALLTSAKMPNLESVQVGSNSKYGVPFSSILRTRGASARDPQTLQKRTGNKILWRTARERKILNYDARPFTSFVNNTSDNFTENPNDHLSIHLQQLGERLYPRVYAINPANAQKITGMILEIPTPQLLSILSSDDMLRQKINEALEIISCKQNGDTPSSSTIQTKKMIPVVLLEHCQVEDNEPLFYSPGKRGFYTPRQGYGTFERLNAFRNIGRLIGLCLQQNELLPLCMQRHVLKYILGRKIKFHDMAFFDPAIYESFRQLLQSSQMEGGEEIINRMELYFVIDLVKEEGGGSVELIPGGREIQVNSSNIFDYVKRYTEYRLIKSQKKALEALRDGVFDVLPETCLNSLTAEDLRLLLNGVGDINVSTLISYTTFNDESSEGSDKLIKFKRWFWSIVEKMNTLERQDLIYFWTGSPALPASEEGFQPLPSVTIRPADDTHLPTANTCISRLYIPLYSSKSILRCKMLLAIKSKNFGFV